MEILITFFLGIFIIAGACVARCVRNTKIIEQLSISAAFGTMLALSIMELFPEAFEQLGKDNVWVIITFIALGVLLLKLLDPQTSSFTRRRPPLYSRKRHPHRYHFLYSRHSPQRDRRDGSIQHRRRIPELGRHDGYRRRTSQYTYGHGDIFDIEAGEKNYQDGSHLRSCFIHVCGRSDNGLALVHDNAFRNRYPHESDSGDDNIYSDL